MPLPPMIDINGSLEEVFPRLDAEFARVFRCKPRREFAGKPLIYNSSIKEGTIEEGVWHVISKGNPRSFDPDRARRLSWIECMLDGTAPGLTRWRYVDGDGTVKVYLWLEVENYVVILAEKDRVIVLVTAFYVSLEKAKKDLARRRRKGESF